MKPFFSILIAIATLASAYFFASKSSVGELDKEAENLYAYDDFFLQARNYPSGKPDVNAYQAAFRDVHSDMLNQQANASRTAGFGLEWESQGAINIGGRINAIAVDPTNDNIIYAGTARGGVFKTINGGTDWKPVFDNQPYLSIGCITIDPSDHNTIYVGTGDPNISGYPSIGDGVYKSTDAGGTWQNIGLAEQRIMSKIIVHPTNPNTLYVATMGLPFERNNKRGVYKTINGGLDWEQILYVSDEAGIIDMVMDPTQPDVLYASSWNRIRNNQETMVEGLDAKIWKTSNGGTDWAALENGLPNGQMMSRVNIAIAPSSPNILYAAYVEPYSYNIYNIYKTTDYGETWEAMPLDVIQDAPSGQGWYYTNIYTSPQNADIVYVLGLTLYKSMNGGESWSTTWNNVHADCHALAFNATGNKVYLGTDGGAYRENNQSDEWVDMEKIPNTQFYRTAYNPHVPNMYFGGTQDNGTIYGNSENVNNWQALYGADGFQPQFDPINDNRVYVEWQNGGILYSNNGGNGFSDGTVGIDMGDRKAWDMPYIISPHNPNVLYTGTYRVYKSESTDAPNWQTVSEDITDGIIYGARFHVVSAIEESPLQEGLLYVGTSDANVWVSENGGESWDSIHQNGLPTRFVSSIKGSKHDANTVFVTLTGYKSNDFLPHVFKSIDKGLTWTSVSGNLPNIAVNSICLMPQSEDVFFVGTDAGVYGTIDGGETWERLGTNMPMVPIYDLVYNPTNNELVAATFARSIGTYPLGDILQAMTGNEVINNNNIGVTISPIPTKNVLQIHITKQEQPNSIVELYNLQGELMLTKNITNKTTSVDMTNLASGVYLLSVRNGKELWHQKVVKME